MQEIWNLLASRSDLIKMFIQSQLYGSGEYLYIRFCEAMSLLSRREVWTLEEAVALLVAEMPPREVTEKDRLTTEEGSYRYSCNQWMWLMGMSPEQTSEVWKYKSEPNREVRVKVTAQAGQTIYLTALDERSFYKLTVINPEDVSSEIYTMKREDLHEIGRYMADEWSGSFPGPCSSYLLDVRDNRVVDTLYISREGVLSCHSGREWQYDECKGCYYL
jgi:hypothetical protein